MFSWTGNLGTESGVGRFNDDLRLLIGERVVQADKQSQPSWPRAPGEPAEEQVVAAQPELAAAEPAAEPVELRVEDAAAGLVEELAEEPMFRFQAEEALGRALGNAAGLAASDAFGAPAEEERPDNDWSWWAERQNYSVDCRWSMYIPGVQHIVHNCTKDLKLVLRGWTKSITG